VESVRASHTTWAVGFFGGRGSSEPARSRTFALSRGGEASSDPLFGAGSDGASPLLNTLSPPPDPPAWLPTVGRVMSVGSRPADGAAGSKRRRRRKTSCDLVSCPLLRPRFRSLSHGIGTMVPPATLAIP
jgi:hypothetical protein